MVLTRVPFPAPTERDPTEGRSSSQPFFLAPYRGKYRTWSNTPPGLHMQKLMEGMRGRGATAVLVEASDMALEQVRVEVLFHPKPGCAFSTSLAN